MENRKKMRGSVSSQGLSIIIDDLSSHPKCPHGPTLLFSKRIGDEEKQYFACSACRDRKLCNFFLWADEKDKLSETKLTAWDSERKKFLKSINHRKLFIDLNKVKSLSVSKRQFCKNCSQFVLDNQSKHSGHSFLNDITDRQLEHPSELLPPLENSKKEAQYLFALSSTQFLVELFETLNYRHVVCIGTPRIHEYIRANKEDMTSVLLDIDDRFHSFFSPLEFCWYNSFNNHFFFEEAYDVFKNYLKSTRGKNTVLITDPPFGGRVEPLIHTFSVINDQFKKLNGCSNDLPIFWIFPYFMEPYIQNALPKFSMLDYKVEYDNHPLFQNGPKGRKQGSPVRIFTNIEPSKIELPGDAYKFCEICSKWVAKENEHCFQCDACTSKNGETYKHCNVCERCVKPSWRHCTSCKRCAQIKHNCGQLTFNGNCLNCKESGHKRNQCPLLMSNGETKRKRQIKIVDRKKIKQ